MRCARPQMRLGTAHLRSWHRAPAMGGDAHAGGLGADAAPHLRLTAWRLIQSYLPRRCRQVCEYTRCLGAAMSYSEDEDALPDLSADESSDDECQSDDDEPVTATKARGNKERVNYGKQDVKRSLLMLWAQYAFTRDAKQCCSPAKAASNAMAPREAPQALVKTVRAPCLSLSPGLSVAAHFHCACCASRCLPIARCGAPQVFEMCIVRMSTEPKTPGRSGGCGAARRCRRHRRRSRSRERPPSSVRPGCALGCSCAGFDAP